VGSHQSSNALDRSYSQKCKPNKVAEFAKIIIHEAVNWVFQQVIGTNQCNGGAQYGRAAIIENRD
jgi:hypothetical protein